MKNEQQTRVRILSRGQYWQQKLGMEWISITHKFTTARPDTESGAETEGEWHYRQATVTWNLHCIVDLEDPDLDGLIIHEYMHICMAPLWDSLPVSIQNRVEKLNELAVENAARAVLSALGIPA